MAAPSFTEILTQLQNACDVFKELRAYTQVNAENFLAHEDTLTQSLEGDFSDAVLRGLASVRAQLSGSLSSASVASILYPLALTMGKSLNIAETDTATLVARLWRKWHENSYDVTSRNLTYGTVTAGGSNVGTGTIYRLTKDELNYNIEACHLETKTFKVIRDANTGRNEHQEQFQITGQNASRDWLGYLYSGGVGVLNCVSAEQSLLTNASFSTYDPSGSVTTKFDGWTITTAAANVTQDTSIYYREAGPGDTAPASIKFTDNDKLVQALSVRKTALDRNKPYLLQVAYYKDDSCDGTLTIRMGDASVAVDLSTKSDETWYVLTLARDYNLWPAVFNVDPCDIEIQLTSNTTGVLYVDDVIFAPFTQFDGTWWFAVGARTPFLLDDYFTFADSLTASDSVIQYWWWRAFGTYLPHTTATPTIADP